MALKKGALGISFGWLFALIVGAVILFLAIYFSMRLIDTQNFESDTKTAKEISVLLDPLETGFESETTTTLSLPSETRIYNRCYDSGNFGKQGIILSQKSFGKWSESGGEVKINNKYIFSEENVEGKNFYLFSKPLYFSFKIADSIVLIPVNEEYCFVQAPEEILADENVLPANIKFKQEDCSSESVKICFKSRGCDVDVNYDLNYLEKNGKKVYFSKDLVYSAILSNVDIYECQVNRIMKKVSVLSDLYLEKSKIVSRKNCNSNLEPELMQLKNFADNFEIGNGFVLIENAVEELNFKNENADCKLW